MFLSAIAINQSIGIHLRRLYFLDSTKETMCTISWEKELHFSKEPYRNQTDISQSFNAVRSH
jgi:hypothetical protein